tara:strand:- start:1318 stop:1617 length:300 start_codon:yes stop_codon:yes gene_type:complete
MTKGWSIYGDELIPAIMENIVDKLKPIDQVVEWEDDDFQLGRIPNLHSLIPYSMEAKKPIFFCTGSDGLRGAHISKARNSREHFADMVETLEQTLDADF